MKAQVYKDPRPAEHFTRFHTPNRGGGAGRGRAAGGGPARPRNWKRLQFPKVTVQFGEPLRFEQVGSPSKEQAQAASEIVFERVREMHSKLVGEGRKTAVRDARDNRRAAAA